MRYPTHVKGIVLAGGTGSRLWPITQTVNKHLLPVYDKPMIYYPISTLMLAGIREILIITTPQDQSLFIDLLGDGSDFGLTINFAVQSEPKGVAEAFIIGEEFLSGDSCMLILGDNIFHGVGLGSSIARTLPMAGAHIFTYEVSNPSDYGVLEVTSEGDPFSITEKPSKFLSNLAVTGLYFFDGNVPSVAKKISASDRGELEITSVIDHYLKLNSLTYTLLSRGIAWLDTGNPDALSDAISYVRIIENRTGLKIACLEEIAFEQGWISSQQLITTISKHEKSAYGRYLSTLVLGNSKKLDN